MRQRLVAEVFAYGKAGRSFRVPNVNDNYSLFTATVDAARAADLGRPRDRRRTRRPARAATGLRSTGARSTTRFSSIRSRSPTATCRRRAARASKLDGALAARGRRRSLRELHLCPGGVPLGQLRRRPHRRQRACRSCRAMRPTPARAGRSRRARGFDASVRYVGEQVFDGDETNTFGRKMPSYTVVDLKLTTRQERRLAARRRREESVQREIFQLRRVHRASRPTPRCRRRSARCSCRRSTPSADAISAPFGNAFPGDAVPFCIIVRCSHDQHRALPAAACARQAVPADIRCSASSAWWSSPPPSRRCRR